MFRSSWLLILFLPVLLQAQQASDQDQLLREVLRRLDTLEHQNADLLQQIKELKQTQAERAPDKSTSSEAPVQPGTAASLEERVQVNEERVAEQAQSKVESKQKAPVWLYGTLLFNAFYNSNDPSYALGQYGLAVGGDSAPDHPRSRIPGPGSAGAGVTSMGISPWTSGVDPLILPRNG